MGEVTAGQGPGPRSEMSSERSRKKGYNWKARLQSGTEKGKRPTESFCVELDESVFGGTDNLAPDTNAPVLPSKKAKLNEDEETCTVKRRKLNAKQRKRLLKVVEAKEKKAKVNSN